MKLKGRTWLYALLIGVIVVAGWFGVSAHNKERPQRNMNDGQGVQYVVLYKTGCPDCQRAMKYLKPMLDKEAHKHKLVSWIDLKVPMQNRMNKDSKTRYIEHQLKPISPFLKDIRTDDGYVVPTVLKIYRPSDKQKWQYVGAVIGADKERVQSLINEKPGDFEVKLTE